ncbi:MAG: CdaR family protein [bacterium]
MTWRDDLRRLRPRDIGESLRWLLLHNAGVKLVSLVIAVGLWFFVNAGERDSEMALRMPIAQRNIPTGLMLVSPRVDFVDLVVRGPRTLLSRIDPEQLSMVLDLDGVRPGPAVFRVTSDAMDLPRGVTVVRLMPSEVTLEFAPKLRKSVPVHVALSGKPPEGFRVTATRAAPESVEVIGPAREVETVKAAETSPIDLSVATAGLVERDLPLEAPSEYVSFSAALVHAQVQVDEIDRTRTLNGAPVVVRNSAWESRVRPATVQLTVRGPGSVVDALELEQGAVYIDASDEEPGKYQRTPAVDLPAGVELVKQEPGAVDLRILRQKRRPDGG